jgi:hypothetical protein
MQAVGLLVFVESGGIIRNDENAQEDNDDAKDLAKQAGAELAREPDPKVGRHQRGRDKL